MKLFITIAFIILVCALSCKKDCEVINDICNEAPPSEGCQAYFSRWFYNKSRNKCQQINYNGCSEYGFATEQECNECKCN